MSLNEKLKKMELDVFRMFDEQWAVLTAGTREDNNMMTISWGSLGTLWGSATKGRPIVTVYVRPERCTHDYLEKSDTFSVSFFPKGYEKELLYLGTRSGHDGDKLSQTKLNQHMVGDYISYDEASLTFVCRKIYRQDFDPKEIPEEIMRDCYTPGSDVHTMYIGEIIDVIS